MSDWSKLHDAVRHEGGISRRLFMSYAAALSSLPWLAQRTNAQTAQKVAFSADPFSVGIASGDPTPSGVVLWTRLAPKPLEPMGGLNPDKIEVLWEIAEDDAMKNVVQFGKTFATPELAHSVHVEVENLKPNRWYWYRFRAGDAESPIGRTRTMPEATATPDKFRFAFASCQHFETGLFTAYDHMAKDELDMVFHLGDYIYEGPGREKLVRKHLGKEIQSLDDYRIRHAQYKSDAMLRAMHARCPWVVTWDDHEVDNNYANDISEQKTVDPVDFLVRRAHAYQAYYEMMPLRASALPKGPNMQLYRKISFGRLAEFLVLDTRQYRGDQPNGDRQSPINEAASDPKNTMLGAKQFDWLKTSLVKSPAKWNVLAQQVMMGMVDLAAGEGLRYSMDQWPGYTFERQQVMKFIAERAVANPIVLTGDIHSNWVNDLRVDDRKHETPIVATEFVGTSISSGGNGQAEVKNLKTLLDENPFIHFHNRQRGYVRCTLTPKTWQSDYQIVANVVEPGGEVVTKASFVVEAGKPGAKTA